MEFISFGNMGAYPTEQGACSSYVVRTKGKYFLFDLGAGSLANILKAIDIYNLSAIFISHWHGDHASDIFTLGYYLQFNYTDQEKIKVYTIDTPENGIYQEAKKIKYLDFINVKDKDEIDIDGVKIKCHKAFHPIATLMFSVESEGKKFLYTADTNYFEGIEEVFENSDAIVCDTCLLHKNWKSESFHLSAKLAAELSKKTNVKKLFLSHFMPGIKREEYLYEAFPIFKNSILLEAEKVYTV